ncbi:phospholipase [Sulfurifustis variabilis]|uniref:Phospholipase n=1 Tax=Sulfurifustis variabilis TaxID=1675686 RepID=A0A1B4V7P8_9GAMM|nr:phospholipase D-like domain-containing protein [Sulfurifustis variabilis]BAU47384.1 phospholipase [Sulfurifustis variabilis]
MSRKPNSRFLYPWREGNAFELLVDGERFYPRMLEAIERATTYVLLEMYLVESGAVSGRFIDALARAARRGVQVKVLLDAFGGLGLEDADRARLTEAGVAMVIFNPIKAAKRAHNLARDHRKLLLVDGEVAYTGGAGLTDEFDPPRAAEHRWRETMIEIHGPVVADWQRLFARVWGREGRRPLDLPLPSPPVHPDGMYGRVEVSQTSVRQEITRSLLKRIGAAEHRVWISTAYFIPSWRIRRALRRAARRGVDVRVVVPGPCTDHPAVRHAGRRFYGRLLLAGVRILEYQPRFLHSKVALCDQWASIGSSNFDRWNLRWNLEANQAVDDPRFAAAVARMLEGDFAAAREWGYRDWSRRPLLARLREYLWGKVDLWLNTLDRKRAPRDG